MLVKLGSVPKAIQFILHAPTNMPSARSQLIKPVNIAHAFIGRQV